MPSAEVLTLACLYVAQAYVGIAACINTCVANSAHVRQMPECEMWGSQHRRGNEMPNL